MLWAAGCSLPRGRVKCFSQMQDTPEEVFIKVNSMCIKKTQKIAHGLTDFLGI